MSAGKRGPDHFTPPQAEEKRIKQPEVALEGDELMQSLNILEGLATGALQHTHTDMASENIIKPVSQVALLPMACSASVHLSTKFVQSSLRLA